MVLPRSIQGSGPLGHVAWVLGIEDDGTTVDVRSMNWSGRGRITFHQLQADGNVQFLTAPVGQPIIGDIGQGIGYTLERRRGVEQW
jgi:hypothetical protein